MLHMFPPYAKTKTNVCTELQCKNAMLCENTNDNSYQCEKFKQRKMKEGKEREEKEGDKRKECQVKRRYCRTKHKATRTSINPTQNYTQN